MEERRLELEPAVNVDGREIVPIAWTVSRCGVRGLLLNLVVVREAFGVITRDAAGCRALLCDGRTMSLDELAALCPDLREPLAALGR